MNELVDGPEIYAAHDWVLASIGVDSKTTPRIAAEATRPCFRSGRGNALKGAALKGATHFLLDSEGVGHGKPNGDQIPFVWKSAGGGGIHNTFAYDRGRDKWSWAIDDIDETDKPSSFSRVTLERKKN